MHLQTKDHSTGAALCLSGGGFRATLFHLGVMTRLNERGVLSRISCYSGVSGGAIPAAVLGAVFDELQVNDGVYTNFDELVFRPVLRLCLRGLRSRVLFRERLNPLNWPRLMRNDFTITNLLARVLADSLGLGVPLRTLPREPRLIICACNLESGACWVFEHDRMGDPLVGFTTPPEDLTLADAVAASSAIPHVFPPLVLRPPCPAEFRGGRADLPPGALQRVSLIDGGICDNLAAAPVMGRYETVLVSDATAPLDFSNNTVQGMITRLIRSFDIVFDTSLELRRERFLSYIRRGALPGCCVRISDCVRVLSPNNDRALGYGPAVVKLLTGIRSDINAFSHGEAGCLVNHGYALADAALGGELADSMGAREAAFAWPFAEYGEDVAAGRVFS